MRINNESAAEAGFRPASAFNYSRMHAGASQCFSLFGTTGIPACRFFIEPSARFLRLY